MSDETGFTIDPDTGQFRLDVSGVADLPDNVFEDVTFNPEFDIFNSPAGSGLFDSSGALNLDYIDSLTSDPAVFSAFAEFDPEAAAVIRNITGEIKNRSFGDQSGVATLDLGNIGDASTAGRDEVELAGPNYGDPNTILKQDDIDLQGSGAEGSGFLGEGIKSGVPEWDKAATDAGLKLTDPNAKTDTKTDTKTGTTTSTTGTNKGLSSLSDLLKYFLPALASYLSYKSAQDARKEARGVSFAARGPVTSTRTTYGGSTYKPAAQGGLMSLAGGGGVSSLTPVVDNPTAYINNVSNALLTMQEGRLRDPELYDSALSGMNLRNIPSMYSELPRSKDELEERDSQLYAAFRLPDLASNPPSEALIKLVDEIRNVLNASSTPSPEQISMYEANQLYSPIESVSVAGKEPQLYVSDNYASELSGDLNPAFERELRHWEQTGQIGGGGGEFEKGTGPTDPMSLYSKGGMTTKQPFYLGGPTDGMADEVPAHIDNKRPAALSDGEFVIPADVVSHLGNGNSNAGAKRLYEMMDRIREARTGNKNQGIQINPNQFMPR